MEISEEIKQKLFETCDVAEENYKRASEDYTKEFLGNMDANKLKELEAERYCMLGRKNQAHSILESFSLDEEYLNSRPTDDWCYEDGASERFNSIANYLDGIGECGQFFALWYLLGGYSKKLECEIKEWSWEKLISAGDNKERSYYASLISRSMSDNRKSAENLRDALFYEIW